MKNEFRIILETARWTLNLNFSHINRPRSVIY